MSGYAETVGFLIIFIGIYFIPTIIAFARGHHYCWVIAAINLIGGFTGIGYLAALIWAVWPRYTSISDVFRSDPVAPTEHLSRTMHERHGEQKKAFDSGEQWFYAIGKTIHGPVGRQEIIALLLRGELQQRDLVWKEGMPSWVRAVDVLPSPT